MLIHSMLPSSSVNGPGDRTVIWLQGCRLKCLGCWNPASHSFKTGNNVRIADLAKLTVMLAGDGVTFSGGEPMHQAAALSNLMLAVRNRAPQLSIGMYTGYSLGELETGDYYHLRNIGRLEEGAWSKTMNQGWWARIRRFLDFAVMGRYNRAQPSDQPLRSSRNQTLELFSGRYTEANFSPQAVEFHIDEDLIRITGFPTKEILYANA